MASLLRTSQPQVSRWAAKGRAEVAAPGRVACTAYEAVQRYAVGVLSREQMLEALVGWPYEPSPPVEVAEWDLVPAPELAGSFEATVGRAHDEGLLSGADYDAVLDALADAELARGAAPVG